MRGVFLACCVAAAGLPARADPVGAHYAGYIKGLNLFDLDLAVTLRDSDYRLQLGFRLTGVLGAMIHADGATVVDGRFAGSGAAPREMFSKGQFRGAPQVMQIDWQDGLPQVLQMVPPPEDGREPVPEREQAHTSDPLSAIAFLLHQVSQTGKCDAAARTYDGARLSEFASRTVGEEMLEPTPRSIFQGGALRCDITGRMIGGFMRGGDKEALRKPKQASAWLARLAPGQPPVPVRIVFYSDGSPSATLYLAQPPR